MEDSCSQNLFRNSSMLYFNSRSLANKSHKSKRDEYRKHQNFSILFLNALSIVNKRDILNALLLQSSATITFLVETWLKPFYPDSFIVDSSNYSITRSDRLNKKGGGVAAIFENSLASKISTVDFDIKLCVGFEILAIDFFHNSSNYSRFICVYLPPNNSKNIKIVQNLIHLLTQLHNYKHETYILGDFNFSSINWKELHLHSTTHAFSEFRTFLDTHNLTQLITFPTHIRGNTLDLFITSNLNTIASVIPLEPLTGSCDHNMIEVKFNLDSTRILNTSRKRNFYKGDYSSINSYQILTGTAYFYLILLMT